MRAVRAHCKDSPQFPQGPYTSFWGGGSGGGRGGGLAVGSLHPAPCFSLRRKILAQGGSLLVSVRLVLVVLATCFCWPTYPSLSWA